MMKYKNIFGGLKFLQIGMIILTVDISLLLGLLLAGISYKVSPLPANPIYNAIWKTLICIAQFGLLSGAVLKIVGLFKAQKHNAAYTAALSAYIVELIAVIISAYAAATSNVSGILAAWVFFITGTLITYSFVLIGAKRLAADVFGDDENRFSHRHKTLYFIFYIVFLFIMPIVVQAVLLHKVKDVKTSDDWITYEKKLTEQE